MPIQGAKLMQHTLFITSRYSIALEKSVTYQDQRGAARSERRHRHERYRMKSLGNILKVIYWWTKIILHAL